MKPTTATILILGVLAGLLLEHSSKAAPGAKPDSRIRDAATHSELSNALRMAQQNDPIRNLGPAIGKSDEDPAAKFAGRDLIKDSTIICFRGGLTLVPKRAVLHIPDALKDRIGEQSGVKVMRWVDFYNANRGWIRTMEVTRDQAHGEAPLSEASLEAIKKSSSLVVATFNGGPISVLPLKEPEDEAAAEDAQQVQPPQPTLNQ